MLANLYFLKKVWNIIIIKWKSTTKKGIKNNSTAPDINFRASIKFARYDLNDEEKNEWCVCVPHTSHLHICKYEECLITLEVYLRRCIIRATTTCLQKVTITHYIT
jgi:hypothetical protein